MSKFDVRYDSSTLIIGCSVKPGEYAAFIKRIDYHYAFCPCSIVIEGENVYEMMISDFTIGKVQLVGVWISANIINGFSRIFSERLQGIQLADDEEIKFTLRTLGSVEKHIAIKFPNSLI